eukprot:1758588-Rhodomonas_salina.1
MAGNAKPMWKLAPQELLSRFKNGENVVDGVISTDASWRGSRRHSPRTAKQFTRQTKRNKQSKDLFALYVGTTSEGDPDITLQYRDRLLSRSEWKFHCRCVE